METTIMSMNRRNVLVGLGTIVAGGGAALGTGAFSSVEAERTVKVSVAEDSDALLGLEDGDSDFVTSSEGTLEIDLSNVNMDATTTLEEAFTIANNSHDAGGNQSITVSISHIEYGDATNASEIDEGTIDEIIEFNADGTDLFNTENSTELSEGGNSKDVEIVIDTSGYNSDDFDELDLVESVTFHADGDN